jgi:hypothetical protein
MPLDRLRFTSTELWGKLVKTWATGKNYLDDGRNYPIPRDLEEFKTQCADAQVGLTLPKRVTGIIVTQPSEEVLLLRLPPKKLIEESEEALKTEPYSLPDFYVTIFGGNQPVVANKLLLHAQRIGDYTMANCL